MTPTSDERREVAARLREDLPVARNVQEGYVAIMQTIGVRPCLLMVEGQSGATMSRDGETWECEYDYGFGAGFDDTH